MAVRNALFVFNLSTGGPLDLSIDGTTLDREAGLSHLVKLVRFYFNIMEV